MSRFIQTILFVFILTLSAFGQERDPASKKRDSVVISQDSLAISQDSLAISQDTIAVSKDTLVNSEDLLDLSRDTLGLQQYYDSIYNIREPDMEVSRSSEMDSLYADSLLVAEPQETRSPSKAIMYALVLPGLGQAYNHKYWKMPIVWAALVGAGYAIVYNTNEYKQASYDYAQNPDDINQRYLEYWRRNMELSYIAMLAVYALQVLDAYVDAQLFSWDVNDNLSIGVSPSLKPLLVPGSIRGYSYGLGCNFNIRGR